MPFFSAFLPLPLGLVALTSSMLSTQVQAIDIVEIMRTCMSKIPTLFEANIEKAKRHS